MFKKILVALDRSGLGQTVFAEALALAKSINANLMLLNVLSPSDQGYPTPIYPGADSVYTSIHEEALKAYAQKWHEYEQQGLELLRLLAREASTAGVTAEFSQNIGDPGQTICQVADTWGADLVIMGRRGRSGLSELVLGSASNYVLHHAPCSVLAVQGKPEV